MENITDEQWQELCEWAGWKWSSYMGSCRVISHESPDGEVLLEIPPQDMNTLFKWMVPKLDEFAMKKLSGITYGVIVKNEGVESQAVDIDPFEALAQAIYKVIKNA